jgi:DNA gyrase subunit A
MAEVFTDNIGDLLKLVDGAVENTGIHRLSEEQANAILDLRLHRLTGLERDKIQGDLSEVIERINDILSILKSKSRIVQIIKDEMLEIKEKFNSPRLTRIEHSFEEMDDEDLIQKEDMVITITLGGYIKRVPLSTYRTQKRGGRGKSGMETKEEDVVQKIIIASNHDEVLFFSSLGTVYKMKVYKLPIGSSTSKSRALVNMLPIDEKEEISAILIVRHDEDLSDKTVIFATSFGNVRRNRFADFASIQSNGKRAISLDANEKLIGVELACQDNDVFISTKNGMCNRFPVDDIRIFVGRASNGVHGIKLKDTDEVISVAILDGWNMGSLDEREQYLKNSESLRRLARKDKLVTGIVEDRMTTLAMNEKFILTVTENGFGKVSSFYEYRATSRGTQGFTNLSITEKNGRVVASFPVEFETQIMMITNGGRVMRCGVEDIRITRRVSQGVIVFRLNDGEFITSVSTVEDS